MEMQSTDDVVMSDDWPGVTLATEERIRNAERNRLAALLEKDGDAISKFVTDPAEVVKMIAYMLRLG